MFNKRDDHILEAAASAIGKLLVDGNLLDRALANQDGPHTTSALAVEMLDTSFELLYDVNDCGKTGIDLTEGLEITAAVRCLGVGVVPAWPDTIYINAIGVMRAYAGGYKKAEEKRNLMYKLDCKCVLINHVLKGSHAWAVKIEALQAIRALSIQYKDVDAGYAQWIMGHGGFAVVTSLLQECNAAAKDSCKDTWAEQQEAIPEIVSMLMHLVYSWETYRSSAAAGAAKQRKLCVVSAMDEGLLYGLLEAISCTEHATAARVAAVMGVSNMFWLFFSDVNPHLSLPQDVGELFFFLQLAVEGRCFTERKMQLPAATRKQIQSMANVAAATLITQLVSLGEEPLALQTALLVTLALLLHINEHARVIAIVSGVIAPILAVLQASRFDPDSSGVFQQLHQLLHLPDDAEEAYHQLRLYKEYNDHLVIFNQSEYAKSEALFVPLVWGNPLGDEHDSTPKYEIKKAASVMLCCFESSVMAAKGLLEVKDPHARGILLRSGLVQDLEILMEQG
eukprot:jgi/Chrzof1/4538/Cz14g17140.t1